jgi:SAM-dependent methyltransferase
MTPGYHGSRLQPDPRRDKVWAALWRHYFSRLIPPDACVLDLGCGYGSFINQVKARRRIAVDCWSDFPHHLALGIEAVVTDVTDLAAIEDDTVDFAFASNLFEHVTQPVFAAVLATLQRKLTASGTLTILQPNWRYAAREYFDDYTHVQPWSHIGMADFLIAAGWEVVEVQPRFLPLTIKSRLPVSEALIGAYLASPFKPLGKQMLVRARPQRTGA